MLTINFIGCGRVGKTIAKLISNNHSGQILGIVNYSMSSAIEAVRYIGQGTAFASIKELPVADVYFISTRDDAIQRSCEELVRTATLKKGAIIIHCSGSMSADILCSVHSAGCYGASVHPVKSFADPDMSVKSFKGTYCATEGDKEALPTINQLFESIGGIVFAVHGENKKLYHAAMVMANNYTVTLHYHAMQSLITAGVDPVTAKHLTNSMMTDAFKNMGDLPHAKALTGPVQRGDIETIQGHLNAIENDTTRHIYSALGSGTVPLTNHSPEIVDELKTLFAKHPVI